MNLESARIIAHIAPDREYPPLPIRLRVTYRPVQRWVMADPFARLSVHRHEWKTLLQGVADRHGVTIPALLGDSRARAVCWPRFEAMYLLRTKLGWSSPQIGRRFGNRDHTSVLAACKRYEDPEVQAWLAKNAAKRALPHSTAKVPPVENEGFTAKPR